MVVWTRINRRVFNDNKNAYFWKRIKCGQALEWFLTFGSLLHSCSLCRYATVASFPNKKEKKKAPCRCYKQSCGSWIFWSLSFVKTFDPTAGHASKKKCKMVIFLAQVFGYTRLLRSSRVTEFKWKWMSKRKEGIFSYDISRVQLQLTAIQVRPARVLQFVVTVGTGCTWTRQGCNFPEFLRVPEAFTRGFQFRLSICRSYLLVAREKNPLVHSAGYNRIMIRAKMLH